MRSLFVLLSVTSLLVRAQDPSLAPRVVADLLTVDDGLPQGLVAAIEQDADGFLWFGTKDGLTRYDGYEFRVFRNVPGDSTSITGDHITALHADADGFLWVGTESNGLDRYDPRTGHFRHIRVDPILNRMGGVVSIREDATGDIWVHEFGGALLVLPDAVGHAREAALLRPATAVYPELNVTRLRELCTTPSGELWLLDQEVLTVWERRNGRFTERLNWTVPWPWKEVEFPPGLMYHAKADHMLLIWERNAVVFDAKRHTVLDTLHLPELQLRGGGLLIDDQERLWGKGPGDIWFRMDLVPGRLEYLRPVLSRGGYLPREGVYCWLMDRTGNIWAGTPGYGVVKYPLRTERFHRLPLDGEPLNHATIVRTDPEGEVLMDMSDLVRLNTAGGVLERDPTFKAMERKGVAAAWFTGARDPAGDLWFGGWTGDFPTHLWQYDHRKEEVTQRTDDPRDAVVSTFHGLGHDLWVINATDPTLAAHQLLRYDTRSGTRTGVFDFPGPIKTGTYREIACWRIATDGSLWMATGQGVFTFEPRSERWRHFHHDAADSTSLPEDMVFSLCFDPDEPARYIWVGTNGKGMVRMEMRSGRCDRHTTTRQGLPNDVIYGILPDTQHNLWISTNQGLCRSDPRTGQKKSYTRSDGIAGNEFNRYSAERSADGRLYFGGMEGITWFDPEDFYQIHGGSPTLITRLKLLNKPITVSDHATFLPIPIHRLEELELPYSERMITFEFANMDLSSPGQNEFRFILEGLNTNWIENGTGHDATFTNLDPGRYRFRVQGRNSDGVWDEQGASIDLLITPPWRGTWWFRTLVFLVCMAALYAFYRYRLLKALEIVMVRDRIARDLHDEIGSTLSSVALYSSVARKRTGDRVPEATEMLGRITESTTAMMESMNDIVWAVNAENDDLEHVVQRMRAYAVRMAEAGECLLHFHTQAGLGSLELGMDRRKNLYLLFKEAVNNAVKYAGCANLRVTLVREGADLVLSVVDDGRGFDPDRMPERNGGGNGLRNMRKRAADMNAELVVRSRIGQGTTITLRSRSGKRSISMEPMMPDGKGAP
ncbi:MAG: hypothetical protein IPI81_09860 [Flavobacteriales bacterium]|nr:hypothetical protein [Flavobacteriales bacterium]MCC6939615.1 hypothetical protein [Flavobacteriales bacterium]